MNPRLEELRKRLLEPPPPSTAPRHTVARRAREAISSPAYSSDEAAVSGAEADEQTPAGQRSRQADSHSLSARLSDDGPAYADAPKAADALVLAVMSLFEPARQCQGRLAEIARASESVNRLTGLAAEVCESLKSFRDHIRKLSASFESMRTFRDELGVLAESFEPVRALHGQVIELSDTVQSHLAEVANGLEPAKALRARIAELGRAMDSVGELQDQFHELSKAFAAPGAPDVPRAADDHRADDDRIEGTA